MPNIWSLEQVRYTKFSICISNEITLNAAKCQCYSLCHFGVIKGKPTGKGGDKFSTPSPLTQIMVNALIDKKSIFDQPVKNKQEENEKPVEMSRSDIMLQEID